jgi:UDP-glucuronate decarboxylase
MENIQHLRDHPNLEFIRHDVVEPIRLEVHEIFHLACPASPKDYQLNPIKTIKTNVLGTLNMLGLAKRVKAKILLTSTSEVYGDPTVSPQSETYWGNVNPIGIRSCYDEGKRVAETLMMEYYHHCGVQTRIARIFNTYGPRLHENDGRVISNFIVQALKNEPITLYGDGSQTRSFCYVDDQVNGLLALMNSNYSMPVNIGNPHEISIHEIARRILHLTHSESTITHKPLPSDDPTQRCPDITLARSLLNWEPVVDLDEGLRRTIDYFQKRILNTA